MHSHPPDPDCLDCRPKFERWLQELLSDLASRLPESKTLDAPITVGLEIREGGDLVVHGYRGETEVCLLCAAELSTTLAGSSMIRRSVDPTDAAMLILQLCESCRQDILLDNPAVPAYA